jgi:uncharacterized protein YjbJ (UPF0337 family)
MNWTQLEGKWTQLKAEAKTQWGKLTEDDLTYVNGHREKLVGKLEERYGLLRDRAQKDVDDWFAKIGQKIDHLGQSHDTRRD